MKEAVSIIEMNEVIAKFMELKIESTDFGDVMYEYDNAFLGLVEVVPYRPNLYWDELMPVWAKLRKRLLYAATETSMKHYDLIGKEITEIPDSPEYAHQAIYDAITYLSSKP